MSHKFDPKKFAKLDSPERRKMLPPEEVINNAGFEEGNTVADIGCGIGYFSRPIARVVGESGMVYGVDISNEMLNEAEKRTESSGLKNITYCKSDENQFPLEDQIIDVVFMANVFHETNDKATFMQEINRVLKPGGSLVIVDWKKESMEMGPPLDHRISIEEVEKLMSQYKIKKYVDTSVGIGHYLIKGLK